MNADADQLQWGSYLLSEGPQFDGLWSRLLHAGGRRVLLILGIGFDDRMCSCLERLLGCGGVDAIDVVAIEFNEGPASPSANYASFRDANIKRLEAALPAERIRQAPVAVVTDGGRRIGARSIASLFEARSDLVEYTDVVVDVSALPRGLYFPLIAKLLRLVGDEVPPAAPNLHVMVAHSSEADKRIVEEGVEENATYLHGFAAATFESEATREQPRIWIPLMGHDQRTQFERINVLIDPSEICPLLPSPSTNPREADDLVLEYRDLLLDQLQAEPRNIIYGCETNPFEVYRQIVTSALDYHRVLHPLGGCKIVLSAMSSKLLSLGALLAAYDLYYVNPQRMDVAVAHVEAQGYSIRPSENLLAQPELYSLWLTGECYES